LAGARACKESTNHKTRAQAGNTRVASLHGSSPNIRTISHGSSLGGTTAKEKEKEKRKNKMRRATSVSNRAAAAGGGARMTRLASNPVRLAVVGLLLVQCASTFLD
jgi:hypothetical protein